MSVSRKFLFVAYVLLFSGVIWGAQQATTPRQPTTSAQTATANQARATISGTVNSASSGQPVRKAMVTLLPGNQANRGQQGFGGAFNAFKIIAALMRKVGCGLFAEELGKAANGTQGRPHIV